MSTRSKASGAALLAVAPEAALADDALAAKAGRKLGTSDAAANRETLAARGEQARRRKATGASTEDPKPDTEQHQDQDGEPDETGPAFGNPFAGMKAPATGGGMALGVIVWALVRAYIGTPGKPSGTAGVKALVNAKLFNKVTK